MKKSLLASTLIAATALAVPAWAESSSDLGFEYNNSQFYTTPSADSDEDYGLKTYAVSLGNVIIGSGLAYTLVLDSNNAGLFSSGNNALTIQGDHNGNDNYFTMNTLTFNYGSSVVVDASSFVFAEGEESVEIKLVIAGSITFYKEADGESLSFSSEDTDTTNMDYFVENCVTVTGGYTLSNWRYEGDTLYATITAASTPEPSMFGTLFGLGAIGFVATRRRRRA